MVSKRGLTKGPPPPSDTLALRLTLKPKYPSKQHARSVAARLPPTATGALIYLPGTPSLTNEDSDQPQPFRQRRYFHYLSGVVDLPDCAVTYDTARDELVLYIPPLDPKEVLWTGMPKSRGECLAEYDVDDVRHSTQLAGDVKAWRAREVKVFEEIVESVNTADGTRQQRQNVRLKPAIDDCRVYKDSYEIGLLRQAIQVSKSAHEAVISALRQPLQQQDPDRVARIGSVSQPTTEADLEATFLSACVSLGAKIQAYEPIVCSGRNCATLHYTANNAPLANKQLLLIDAGAEWKCYASDITRTYPLSGSWTPEAKAIYDIVERMQREAIAQTLDGVSWRKTHFLAARIATEGLRNLGILRGGTVDEIFKAGTWRAFFPHGLGHMIGLETHDKRGRGGKEEFHAMVNRVLKAGMVVTVEPGVYFCEWIVKPYLTDLVHGKYINSDVLDKYWDVGGVRIEDVVWITKTGNEVLSKDIPRGW
ncbi:peptidase M24, structural domain-containing protein [Peziza echinospora]|nr:peptidase M24, structural domain-containing protein [Peziza echinospora]